MISRAKLFSSRLSGILQLRRGLQGAKYGQPTPWTHKHLLQEDEVNVGIKKTEFQKRREKLADKILELRKKDEKSLVILPSARKKYMIDHIPYFFRQDTDFRYFTGCLQPESILVMEISKSSSRSYLFLQENSSYTEKWEGAKFGLREAVTFLGVDEALPIDAFQDVLYRMQKENRRLDVWYDLMDPRDPEIHKTVLSFISSISQGQHLHNFEGLRRVAHEIRSVKSSCEVDLMRKTCRIGAEAMKKTMSKSLSLKTESEYLATIDYESRMLGANHLAYPPVVAAGENANVIHYISATSAVKERDLMLIDSGTEYHGYSSDITRTWPVSGSMTDGQRCIYQIVLDCQEDLIRSVECGQTSIDQLYRSMQMLLGKSLRSLGLISSDFEDSLAARFTHQFCPHNVGHHLGMDVHDCASVSKVQPLVAGNVITIEPGIYIPKHNTSVPEEFRGIGIRIEDDILITNSGCEVLSSNCPKSIDEVQTLIQRKD